MMYFEENDQINPLISIIIPVYNVKEFLDRCLNSCVPLLSENVEVIVVDDGSTDGSAAICDQFVDSHKYCSVIHKSNGGLSAARNSGIQNAKGQYVVFVDSDDSINCSEVIKVMEILSKYQCDVIYGKINWIKDSERHEYFHNIPFDNIYSGIEALALELSDYNYSAMAQLGFYRKQFLEINNLFFKQGILHEDEEWSPRVEIKAKTIMNCNYPFYNYFIREGSIARSVNPKRYTDLCDIAKGLRKLYAQCNNKTVREYGYIYVLKLYMNAYSKLYALGYKEKLNKELFECKILNLKDLMKRILFLIAPKIYSRAVEK